MRLAYRYIFNLLIASIVAFALFVAFDLTIIWSHYPPSYVVDIRSYLQWQPQTKRLIPVDVEGRSYYFCYGKGLGMIPSGPSAYVFDGNGKKVDWSKDIGDDLAFNQRWNAQKLRDSNREISVAETLSRLRQVTTQSATNTR